MQIYNKALRWIVLFVYKTTDFHKSIIKGKTDI